MRRLQHLAGVLRVEVGVVVAHAIRDFEQDLAQGRRIGRRGVPRRERVETLLHARQRVMEQEQRVRIELAGHAAPIVPAYFGGCTRLMTLPQASSKSTALIGPICFGSPRNLTPRALKRLYSALMSFVVKAVAGMPASNIAFW